MIPISNNVRKILNQQVRNLHDDLVFQLKGKEIREMTLSKEFLKDCAKAGIPAGTKTAGGIVFRDIRTTVKTGMVNAGIDSAYRDALLGHSRKGMDTYYIQIDPKNLIPSTKAYEHWLNSNVRQVLDRREKSGD